MTVAACGSSSNNKTASSPTTAASSPSTTTAAAGVTIAAAPISSVGTVLVDGRGMTLYALTNDQQKNVPCEDDSGCTKVWPDLPLPDGVTAATAGSGIQASLLGTTKESSGETYPTYGGFSLYTFVRDTAPGQANGEGIKSFGGTWSAVTPDGKLAIKAQSTSSGSGSPSYP
jgi:predicted lipoprotein with Yx(FWY)xxD motif